MITVEHLTKRFGEKVAVDDLSFEIRPGAVTGFLGPNGAGKSTTMRCIVGLDTPNAGFATIGGERYASFKRPFERVGAILDLKAFNAKRSARNHLLMLADASGISKRRVDEVLELVGLTDVARRQAGTYSLGMGQRLGLAVALLGKPELLILDEPSNGLDPEGILWMRSVMKHHASEGGTVFVSSHLLSEMDHLADDLVVIGKGKLIATGPLDQFVASNSQQRVRLLSPNIDELTAAFADHPGVTWQPDGEAVIVHGLEAHEIGTRASQLGAVLYELTPIRATLEEAYFDATSDASEFDADGDQS